MKLLIDKKFREAYSFYLSELSEATTFEKISDVFTKYDPDIVLDAVNIIKAATTVNMKYEECHDLIVSKIISRFPSDDDIDLFILSLTMRVLIAMGDESISNLICKPRDINREAAAKYFRVPTESVTEEMVEEVIALSDSFMKQSYSCEEPVTKSWDKCFYNICCQVARNSKCLSRKIGAVLVWDKGIISTGYNGPPRGVPRCDTRWKTDKRFFAKYLDQVKDQPTEGLCPRRVIGFGSGKGLELCPAGHAERNALINAARKGIQTKGAKLYMTCSIPCTPCLVEIINAGVKGIVVTSLAVYDETAMYLLDHSDLEVRLFDFIR